MSHFSVSFIQCNNEAILSNNRARSRPRLYYRSSSVAAASAAAAATAAASAASAAASAVGELKRPVELIPRAALGFGNVLC